MRFDDLVILMMCLNPEGGYVESFAGPVWKGVIVSFIIKIILMTRDWENVLPLFFFEFVTLIFFFLGRKKKKRPKPSGGRTYSRCQRVVANQDIGN